MIYEAIILITYIAYLVFGFYSFYFAMVTPVIPKETAPAVKLLYYHGLFFIVVFIATVTLSSISIGTILIVNKLSGI
tara:strand:- start:444 stop:674 length:231 start_codon:yes stop_codon:yes gene_type:complete